MSTGLEDLLPLLSRISADRETRISLAELASQAHRSPSHFQRTFARLVGESPKQFTRRLQLECAAALLLTTQDSVLNVALASGFDSHEGFTRAFSRHFGRSPTQFRTQAAPIDAAQRLGHAHLISTVGPCLRLFRTSTPQPARTMNYDITQQSLESLTVLVQRTQVEQAKISEALAKILPAAFGYATAHNIAMTGQPLCRYLQWGPALVTIEAGVQVVAGSVGNTEVEAKVYPATQAAVTTHTGPYDSLGDAHAALELYLHEHDLKPSEAPYEIYLTDPGETPDPAQWKTQVIWPIQG